MDISTQDMPPASLSFSRQRINSVQSLYHKQPSVSDLEILPD